MDYTSVPDVELVTVGMKWPGVNGDMTFTFEHLADAMEAANNDPHVKAPRIKIGHSDPRFDDGIQDHNPFYDGEPAFGHVENLRLENSGAVLVGDFTEVPVWLADAMPSAYPNRSIEGAYLDGSWDVETPGGKHYSFVLTACALLGVYLPAVSDLEDLQRLLTEGPKEGDVGIVTDGDVAKAAVAAGSGATAAADVDKVIDIFMRDFATEEENRYWWWPRAIWTDPNEVIADDDEGHLFRVPFTSNDQGEVTFTDPVEVRETFVDVTNGQPVAASKREGDPVAVFASREDERFPERSKPTAGDRPEQEDTLDPKEIRESLGLAEDASDDDVRAKLAELNPDPESEETTDPEASEETEEETETETEREPVAAGKKLTVEVDKGVWEETQRQAKEGAAARSEQLTERREGLLSDAVKAGKITPASKDAWRTKLQATPEATEGELEKLPPGLVPVEEEGAAGDDLNDSTHAAVMRSFGVEPREER